jgi:hypothetical protein
MGIMAVVPPGISTPTSCIQVINRPRADVSGVENGTLFSCLQATTQA